MAQQMDPAAATDEAAIRQIVRSVETGWNAGDAAAFAAPFAVDADYVVVDGKRLKGRPAIEEGHAAIYATIYKGSRIAGEIENLRFLSPEVAVVHVRWVLEYPADGEKRTTRAMNSMVMTRAEGEWSIAAFHNTPILEQGR
jgi:uncharacterized protein (TIGR02246 family)